MTNENEQKSLDSWDGFLGSSFLKAENVKDGQIFICKGLEITDEGRPRLVLESEKLTWQFDINVTNANLLKDLSIANPKELIGKKIFFRKTTARNPNTNKEVPTLRIDKVE